jgi:hypothetical protein
VRARDYQVVRPFILSPKRDSKFAPFEKVKRVAGAGTTHALDTRMPMVNNPNIRMK